MPLPDPNRKNELMIFGDQALERSEAFDVLANMREENVWLANQSSHHTRESYRKAVASFVATMGIAAPDDLYAVRQAHIIAWRSALETAGLSHATIRTQLAAVSSLYKHLADKQLVPSNPCAGVKRPKTGNAGAGSGKTPTLSPRQVRAMLDAPDTNTLQGLRDRAILHILFYLGPRRNEVSTPNVRDFSYDAEYRVITFKIKGGKTNSVAMNPECADAIREYLAVAPHGADQDAPLFQTVKNGKPGQRLSGQQIYKLFERYAVKAGIDVNVYTHMARATALTRADEAGADITHIQQMAGHKSVTTTQGYIHSARKNRDSPSLKISY